MTLGLLPAMEEIAHDAIHHRPGLVVEAIVV
jgi:hypothetical protein